MKKSKLMEEYEINSDKYFMNFALKEAKKAFEKDEVPIGSILVLNNKIISKAYNQTETLQDSTAHAEMIAITTAMQYLGSKYLQDATIFVTVEPCIMCAGAIFWSKISRLVYATKDEKLGYFKFEKVLNNNNLSILHPKMKVKKGVLKDEAEYLMKEFFRKKRQLK